ncbi:MAG TPA: DUF4142 domain-containing protein [Azospirillum sp.]|nr:DUF4142 domain-containing protein [Azospirillum sp.]
MATTAVALLASGGPSLAQQSPNSPQQQTQQKPSLSEQDRQFVQQAGIGNQFEIQAGEIAKSKAGDNQQLQQFSERMIDDHRKAGDQLAKIVKPLNVQVPQQLDNEHRQKIEALRGLSGEKFASTYVQGQIDAHKQTISLFEKQSNSGQNQDLKTFATDTLPTLREHLTFAQDLSKRIPMAAAGSSGQQQASNQQGTDIQVRQPAADVAVQQPAPQVSVQQPAPQVSVQQPQPQVTIQQPKPEVTVQQAKPDVTVEQAKPQVTVEQGKPEITIRQPDQAQVTVNQPEQRPGDAQQAARPDAARQQQAQATTQPPSGGNLIRAEEFIGKTVIGANGEELGEIEDVLIDPQSRRAEKVIFARGGFLGIGEKQIAIDASKLQPQPGSDRFQLSGITLDEVKAMPEFRYDDSMTSLNRR